MPSSKKSTWINPSHKNEKNDSHLPTFTISSNSKSNSHYLQNQKPQRKPLPTCSKSFVVFFLLWLTFYALCYNLFRFPTGSSSSIGLSSIGSFFRRLGYPCTKNRSESESLLGKWVGLPGKEIVDEETGLPVERAKAILERVPLIDGHVDLPYLARMKYRNQFRSIHLNPSDEKAQDGIVGHVDIPKLREGRVGGFFWSVYTDCPDIGRDEKGKEFLEPNWRVRDTLEQIDISKILIQEYNQTFALTPTSSSVRSEFSNGRISSLLGVEGAHQLGNSLATLRQYYDLGVRYVTLTHACNNAFADSCGYEPSFEGVWGGLSDFGRTLIKEMNRIGMIVDISHTSPSTASQALSLSQAPPIYSHSDARGVHDVPRNVPDSTLRRIGKFSVLGGPNHLSLEKRLELGVAWEGENRLAAMDNGKNTEGEGNDWGKGVEENRPIPSGDIVIMINFAPQFVSERDEGDPKGPGKKANIARLADHADRIGDLAGRMHVGIGSDLDGIATTPEGLEDASKYPYLVAELIKRGWSDDEIEGFAGGNVLRVLEKVEKVSADLKAKGAKIETEIWKEREDL